MGASIASIRSQGTDIIVQGNDIAEPLSPPQYLANRLVRFSPDIYNTNVDSHLYRYLYALAGDSGAGMLKRLFFTSTLQGRLESVHFSDLDKFFGLLTNFPRDVSEQYTYDPRSHTLTSSQWQEVYNKDGSYRARGLAWMKALEDCTSPVGIQAAVSSILGIDCLVFEQYQYYDNPTIFPNLGKTNSRREFVIVPLAPSVPQADLKTLSRLVDKVRPANSVVSVYSPSAEDQINNPVTNYIPRIQENVLSTAASSTFFNVRRFVTGDPSVNWPAVNPSKGYWIVGGEEIEAPSFAFSDPQGDAVFATIASISASSYHTGPFNKTQQQLFANLTNVTVNDSFPPQNAIAQTTEPLETSSQWVTPYGADPGTVIVNIHYPIDYLEIVPLNNNSLSNPSQYFWASEQELAGTSETLTIDIGAIQQCNWIDFESTQKPIDIQILTSTDGINYTPISPEDEFTYTGQLAYLPSKTNPWVRHECQFETVMARYIQIVFTRRDDAFPLPSSTPFPWSIEARNLRLAHVVFDTTDDVLTDDQGNFINDVGLDILGNKVRTSIYEYSSSNVLDATDLTYWKCQPNPSPFAVESLYFDLRLSTLSEPGIQGLIDTYQQSNLDTFDQSDIEIEYPDGQVVNEIYIDPVTLGPSLRLYYSNDDTPEWDFKLWTPINVQYILKKGFIYLPYPVLAKYMKFEFTNLVPHPYDPPSYPPSPPIIYNKYPAWVQLLFNTLYPVKLNSQSLLFPFDTVTIDPLTFGFLRQTDKLDAGVQVPYSQPLTSQQIAAQAALNISSPGSVPNSQEADVTFNNSFMWQEDLVSQLDTESFLSRFVMTDHSTLLPTEPDQEMTTPDPTVIDTQSVVLLDASEKEKKLPTMFFPITCRHQYQQIETARPTKVAYFVGINSVSFYRRDYTTQFDELYYAETLDDSQNISENDLTEMNNLFSVPTLPDVNVITNPAITVTLNTSLEEDFDEANGALLGS